jgi:hypothetical protein
MSPTYAVLHRIPRCVSKYAIYWLRQILGLLKIEVLHHFKGLHVMPVAYCRRDDASL